ncbi:MAG: hypothetical protein JOZ13_08085 [Alphaproteobacteria bacterium]|nr:hypothetical protein [Alphaproteobacteria bacterium]
MTAVPGQNSENSGQGSAGTTAPSGQVEHHAHRQFGLDDVLMLWTVMSIFIPMIWVTRRLIRKKWAPRWRQFEKITAYAVPAGWLAIVTIIPLLTMIPAFSDVYWQFVVIVGLLGTFLPLCFIEVKSSLDEIALQAAKTKEAVDRTQQLQFSVRELLETSYRILTAYRQKLVENFFNKFSDSDQLSTEHKKICLEIYGQKFEEMCEQLDKQEMYLRSSRFEKIWSMLAAEPDYQSICDLSSYSRAKLAASNYDTFYYGLQTSWDRRLTREIKTLDSYKGTFQKVLVYSKPAVWDKASPPPCRRTEVSKCDHVSCPASEKCIVKPIATHWVTAAKSFNAKHATGGADRWSIHLISREVVEARVQFVNNAYEQAAPNRHGLDSIDIGLFGTAFVGEEFKVPIELDDQQHLMKDYLYRIRHKPELVAELREAFGQIVVVDAELSAA